VALKVRGERVVPVDGLPLEDAVELFVARAARPPTVAEREEVQALVDALDRMPLAIELAAARVRLLPPEAILQRLSRTLDLLSAGSRDLPDRQRTLRGAIAWSYDLLTPAEQALYRRLAVFVGGCTLEAAEAVIGVDEAGAGLDVVDGIASLVDKSLLRRDEGGDAEPRFRMLETIREYALERLVEAGESDRFHRRHADGCLTLAEQAEPGLIGPRQAAWLDRLEADHDNLRAALSWLARHGLAEHGLRLGAALRRFWRARGYITEGRERMSALLSLLGARGRTASRAKALHAAGWLAREQGDYGEARGLFEESLDIYRELDDTRGIGWALVDLGFLTRYQGDYVAARSLLEESLGLLKRVGDTEGMAASLGNLGLIARGSEGYAPQNPLYREVLARALSQVHQDALPDPWWPWQTAEGRLDLPALVEAFLAWWGK
jgi:non-specific serine/threonine protein kinase